MRPDENQAQPECQAMRMKAPDQLRQTAKQLRWKAQELLRRADAMEELAMEVGGLSPRAEEALWHVACGAC